MQNLININFRKFQITIFNNLYININIILKYYNYLINFIIFNYNTISWLTVCYS
jgi:hypothetical protein